MADADISTLAGNNTSKQKPPALTAREERTLYRAMGILETHLKRPASETLNSPNAVRDYLTLRLAREESEQFMVIS
jgi:DNA repair protein RadC